MTIKITQVSNSTGEIILTLFFDNPKDSGKMETYNFRKGDFYEILMQVCKLLGRPATLTDAQQVLAALVNQIRSGSLLVPQNFDFTPYIGVELET